MNLSQQVLLDLFLFLELQLVSFEGKVHMPNLKSFVECVLLRVRLIVEGVDSEAWLAVDVGCDVNLDGIVLGRSY